MNVRYRPRALADIDAIFQYLDERSPTGARNVPRAIADAIDSIANRPWPRRAPPTRLFASRFLNRYRYKIFYCVVREEFVEIIHVRHAARRPWM